MCSWIKTGKSFVLKILLLMPERSEMEHWGG